MAALQHFHEHCGIAAVAVPSRLVSIGVQPADAWPWRAGRAAPPSFSELTLQHVERGVVPRGTAPALLARRSSESTGQGIKSPDTSGAMFAAFIIRGSIVPY